MTSEMMGGYGCCWPFLPFPLSELQFWAWKWFERTSVVTDLLWASFVFRVKVGVAVYLCLNSHRGREWVPSWENPQQLYRLNCQGNLLSHSVPTGQRLAYYRLQAKSAPTSFYKWRLTETQPCLSVDVFSMATFVLWRQSWVAATEIIWSVKSKKYLLTGLFEKTFAGPYYGKQKLERQLEKKTEDIWATEIKQMSKHDASLCIPKICHKMYRK